MNVARDRNERIVWLGDRVAVYRLGDAAACDLNEGKVGVIRQMKVVDGDIFLQVADCMEPERWTWMSWCTQRQIALVQAAGAVQ